MMMNKISTNASEQEPYISRGLVAKFSVARSVGPILELLKVVRYEIENVFVNLLDIF